MRRLAPLCAAVLLAGCTTLVPQYERPAPAVPQGWPAGSATLAATEADLAQLRYQDIFRDPRLQRLIEQGLSNNRNLASAAADIRAARAQYRIQRSSLIPDLSANGGVNVGYGARGATTGLGTGAGTGDPSTGTPTTGTPTTGAPVAGTGGGSDFGTFYTASVGTTAFEIDLFGRLAALNEAALNEYFATESAARSVRLTLVGDIARAWATYAADAELAAIAEDTAASAQRSVDLTRARLEGGYSPRTELRQAESVLFTAQSDLAAAREALVQDENALRLLVGAEPDATDLPDGLAALNTAFGPVPAGLDSTILLRRPDIVAAEYRLQAANARIGAARAALFPRISLTALLGIGSTSLTGLFSGDNFQAALRPGIGVPIFDGGARRGGVALARAQEESLVAGYQFAVQTAFREVADALATRGAIDDRLSADQRQVAAALDNFELNQARYRGGIDTFLTTLDAQRTLYAARRRLAGTELADAISLADLYVALGGDGGLAGRPIEPSSNDSNAGQ